LQVKGKTKGYLVSAPPKTAEHRQRKKSRGSCNSSNYARESRKKQNGKKGKVIRIRMSCREKATYEGMKKSKVAEKLTSLVFPVPVGWVQVKRGGGRIKSPDATVVRRKKEKERK